MSTKAQDLRIQFDLDEYRAELKSARQRFDSMLADEPEAEDPRPKEVEGVSVRTFGHFISSLTTLLFFR